MSTVDTIVAIASPPGQGGVGLVRLSGPCALSIGQQLFHSKTPLGKRPRHVEYGTVIGQGGDRIDDSLAWFFKGPASYTGEDTVEISCHGSMVVLEDLLDAALLAGATLAQPGEFTRRAFLNGKIDLLQAEAVVDLIQAGSRSGLAAAYGVSSGRLSRLIGQMKDEVIQSLAVIETGLDFVEEDLDSFDKAELTDRLTALHHTCDRLIDTFTSGRRRQEGFQVVILGPPNAGKSTLLNALLEEDKAIVTPLPGTTRDAIDGRLILDGQLLCLSDTAGIRSTNDSIEQEGVRRSLSLAAHADLILWLVDSTELILSRANPASMLPPEILKTPTPVLGVFNKTDLLGEEASFPSETGPLIDRIFISALNGTGLHKLKKKIVECLPRTHDIEGIVITRERHLELLQQVSEHLNLALQMLQSSDLDECLAAELRLALDGIALVLGEDVSDDILDRIFAEFCIGK